MNADNKRLIKQFVLQRLWGDGQELDALRANLGFYATRNDIDRVDAMEEYEYQVERISKLLDCH